MSVTPRNKLRYAFTHNMEIIRRNVDSAVRLSDDDSPTSTALVEALVAFEQAFEAAVPADDEPRVSMGATDDPRGRWG